MSLNMSSNMSSNTSTALVNTAQTPSQSEAAQLASSIQEWKRLHDELTEIRQTVREKSKKAKVLEDVIMRIMKKNNIGALDMISSGGRVLYKKKSAKVGLNPASLVKNLSEFLKDETKASEAVEYIAKNRESKVRESLLYEKNETLTND